MQRLWPVLPFLFSFVACAGAPDATSEVASLQSETQGTPASGSEQIDLDPSSALTRSLEQLLPTTSFSRRSGRTHLASWTELTFVRDALVTGPESVFISCRLEARHTTSDLTGAQSDTETRSCGATLRPIAPRNASAVAFSDLVRKAQEISGRPQDVEGAETFLPPTSLFARGLSERLAVTDRHQTPTHVGVIDHAEQRAWFEGEPSLLVRCASANTHDVAIPEPETRFEGCTFSPAELAPTHVPVVTFADLVRAPVTPAGR